MKWFEADQRWSLYVNSKEEYLEKFVVLGKFHQKVPKDICDAFETVSYLMAHSYYHWPMYDEALSKSLLIMEMAIKQKARLHNIPLEITTSKGRVVSKKLVEIIKDVLDNGLSFLKEDFDRIRTIRNFKVHPSYNFFMGGLGHAQTNIIRLVNAINFLFLDHADLDSLLTVTESTTLLLNSLKTGVYILELPDRKILTDSIISLKYVHYNKGIYFLVINPVLINTFESLLNKKYPQPVVLSLKSLTVKDSRLSAIDMNDNKIEMYLTENIDNQQKYKEYCSDLDRTSASDKAIYKVYTQDCAFWEIERMVYKNCW